MFSADAQEASEWMRYGSVVSSVTEWEVLKKEQQQ